MLKYPADTSTTGDTDTDTYAVAGCCQANKQTGQEAAECQQLRFGLGLGPPAPIVVEAAISRGMEWRKWAFLEQQRPPLRHKAIKPDERDEILI